MSVGTGVGVSVGEAVGVDVSALLLRGSVVVLGPIVLPGNGAVANTDDVSRNANNPLNTTSKSAKMKMIRCTIRDAFLIPSCFKMTPASFLPTQSHRLRPCKDFLRREYLLHLPF